VGYEPTNPTPAHDQQNVLLIYRTAAVETVKKRLEGLHSRIEKAPRSMGWKMRARIGEKKQWYELPERDKEVVDSRNYGTAAESPPATK